MKKIIALTTVLMASSHVLALDISDEDLKKKGVAAEVEAGLDFSTGNTENTNIRGRVAVDYFWQNWRHYSLLEGNSSHKNEETTAERYLASYKVDRSWSDANYTYGNFVYENDRFNGLENMRTISSGYGHRLEYSSVILDTEIGPGYRWNDAGEGSSEWIARGAVNLDWKITDGTKFTEKFTIDAGQSNTISRSETALSTSIIGALAMKLSVTMTHQSQPDDSKEKLDTKTAVTLLYRY